MRNCKLTYWEPEPRQLLPFLMIKDGIGRSWGQTGLCDHIPKHLRKPAWILDSLELAWTGAGDRDRTGDIQIGKPPRKVRST
jgi:hypothetical protein